MIVLRKLLFCKKHGWHKLTRFHFPKFCWVLLWRTAINTADGSAFCKSINIQARVWSLIEILVKEMLLSQKKKAKGDGTLLKVHIGFQGYKNLIESYSYTTK